VLEKGWIGGGNTGRNTTIIRSNYLFDESAALYDHAVKLWEHLSQELNYNVMFSQRGVMMLAHTVHDMQVFKRHVHANRCNGVDNEWLTPEQAKAFCPPLNISPNIRYPVLGAALQRRGGTARHDAVAWGYARAADALGVDIIENCEVTGIRATPRRGRGVETTRGLIRTRRSASPRPATPAWSWRMAGRAHAAGELSAAGAGVRTGQAGLSLRGDVEHHPRLHQPVRQGRAGDRRRHRRLYLLHPARRLHINTHTLDAICELFPSSAACACCATGAASST
jgi:sarcosine oxidase subunit beta